MLRILEREEDKAAPRVPDDNANAAERGEKKERHFPGWFESQLGYMTDSQDVFLPKLGPDS
jgi:hypothetical protein